MLYFAILVLSTTTDCDENCLHNREFSNALDQFSNMIAQYSNPKMLCEYNQLVQKIAPNYNSQNEMNSDVDKLMKMIYSLNESVPTTFIPPNIKMTSAVNSVYEQIVNYNPSSVVECPVKIITTANLNTIYAKEQPKDKRTVTIPNTVNIKPLTVCVNTSALIPKGSPMYSTLVKTSIPLYPIVTQSLPYPQIYSTLVKSSNPVPLTVTRTISYPQIYSTLVKTSILVPSTVTQTITYPQMCSILVKTSIPVPSTVTQTISYPQMYYMPPQTVTVNRDNPSRVYIPEFQNFIQKVESEINKHHTVTSTLTVTQTNHNYYKYMVDQQQNEINYLKNRISAIYEMIKKGAVFRHKCTPETTKTFTVHSTKNMGTVNTPVVNSQYSEPRFTLSSGLSSPQLPVQSNIVYITQTITSNIPSIPIISNSLCVPKVSHIPSVTNKIPSTPSIPSSLCIPKVSQVTSTYFNNPNLTNIPKISTLPNISNSHSVPSLTVSVSNIQHIPGIISDPNANSGTKNIISSTSSASNVIQSISSTSNAIKPIPVCISHSTRKMGNLSTTNNKQSYLIPSTNTHSVSESKTCLTGTLHLHKKIENNGNTSLISSFTECPTVTIHSTRSMGDIDSVKQKESTRSFESIINQISTLSDIIYPEYVETTVHIRQEPDGSNFIEITTGVVSHTSAISPTFDINDITLDEETQRENDDGFQREDEKSSNLEIGEAVIENGEPLDYVYLSDLFER